MSRHPRAHGADLTPRYTAWLTPRVRRYVYGITTAMIPLLVAYGAIEETTAPLWLALAASITATGTAWAHTPGDPE